VKKTSFRIFGTIPDELDTEMIRLFDEGYTPSDIVKEGTRLLIAKKRSEWAAEDAKRAESTGSG
jgi:hypothetical protein